MGCLRIHQMASLYCLNNINAWVRVRLGDCLNFFIAIRK